MLIVLEPVDERLDEMRERFASMGERSANAATAMAWMANTILPTEVDRHFESGGDHLWSGWPPITDKWRRRKVAMGYDERTMHMTHRLRNSLSEVGHPDQEVDVGASSLHYATKVPYARYHQRGGAILPQRKVIHANERVRMHFVSVVGNWIVHGKPRSTVS